jgi:hypothetical protein
VRKNALFGYGLLLCVGLVNWDIVIARYNFLHTKAYIHLSFLMDRSDAALPYLDIPVDELERLNIRQEKIYGPGRDDVPAEEYAAHISRRIKEFRSGYTKRHWLAWNYADWNSYHMLQNKEKDFDHRP